MTSITVEETKTEKEFIIDSDKIALTNVEYLNELDARITNLENLFNIKVKRKVTKIKP